MPAFLPLYYLSHKFALQLKASHARLRSKCISLFHSQGKLTDKCGNSRKIAVFVLPLRLTAHNSFLVNFFFQGNFNIVQSHCYSDSAFHAARALFCEIKSRLF